VAFIQNPGVDLKRLAKSVFQKTGARISTEQIQMLFDAHGVKKRPEFRSQSLACTEPDFDPALSRYPAGSIVPEPPGHQVPARRKSLFLRQDSFCPENQMENRV
jgi:hypothetical protein